MNQHRPVPGISRGPQQFARSARAPVQSPMGMSMPVPMPVLGSAQQPTLERAIEEEQHDLAMEIYCRLVSKHIATTSELSADPELFQELAKASKAAARAYFESVSHE